MNQRWVRNSFVYLLILVAIIGIFWVVFPNGNSSGTETTITDVLTKISANPRAASVAVDGNNITLVIGQEKFKTKKSKTRRRESWLKSFYPIWAFIAMFAMELYILL